MVQHCEAEGASVPDKTSGAGNSVLGDGGGGVLGLEMEDFILEFADGVFLVGSLFEHLVDGSPHQALGDVVYKAFLGEGLHNCEC